MDMDNIRDTIINANRAYRLGRPVMSDQEFDDLCETYQGLVTEAEYETFRNALHEDTGKVRHPYIMGSLDKLKSDEPDSVCKWLRDYVGIGNNISISAKVDGISCRLHYENGKFVSATTRGDGTSGIDCTDKVRFIGHGLPVCVNPVQGIGVELDVRGELVITDSEFATISGQFANPRNACAGLMGQKTPTPELLSHITFLAYEVMGGTIPKGEQFKMLKSLGFETPWHGEPLLSRIDGELVGMLTNVAGMNFGYPTDGLVLSSTSYMAEDRYRPLAQRAFKINQLVSTTAVMGVEWGEPSKDGRMCPVALIDPVEIGGSTISRVTLNNVDWIRQMGIGIGSVVEIVKSGDVIPKITKVLLNDGVKPIELPTVCPVCGTPVVLDGCDIRCPNEDCPSRGYESVLSFITNIGIKRISRKTIEAWALTGIPSLLQFKANPEYKMQVYFEREINGRILGADEVEIFKALPFRDLAEITLTKIIGHYGYGKLKSGLASPDVFTFPEGVGKKTMDAFMSCAGKNFKLVDMILSDPRYHGKRFSEEDSVQVQTKGSVCFTGALNTMTRTEASKKAVAAGYEVKSSVVKGLTYLVTNDPNSGSSKNKRAQQLGTKIITEEEFLALL